MILRLISVKEYCKLNNITDAAVRKRIKNNTVESCSYDDQIYIIINDTTDDNNKHKIKLLSSNIKALRNEIKSFTKQEELLLEQKNKIEKLEIRNEKLEFKLELQYEKKEELFEKVIGHMTLLENKKEVN